MERNSVLVFNNITFFRYLNNERMIPFGIGKRACMGELLARNEVFLFTANLVQRMKFLPPKNHSKLDPARYQSNFTNIPEDFYVRFVMASNE